MWKHYLKITQFYQKIYPLRMVFNRKTSKFEPVHKPSKLYLAVNFQVIQIWLVAFSRILYYLKTDSSKSTLTFTDFVVEFLFWGLTILCPAFVVTLWEWKDNLIWFLNQAYKHRKMSGEYESNAISLRLLILKAFKKY